MDMREKRKLIFPLADLLAYKVRSCKLTYPIADQIWRIALKNAEQVGAITAILDIELPDEETLKRVQALIDIPQ